MVSSIPIEYEYFLNRSIWPVDGTLKGSTNPGEGEPTSKSNEGVLHIPRISITGASRPSWEGGLPLCSGKRWRKYQNQVDFEEGENILLLEGGNS